MGIWNKKPSTEDLNKHRKNSLVNHLNIIITDIGDDYIEGTMPVDKTTIQPHGVLPMCMPRGMSS